MIRLPMWTWSLGLCVVWTTIARAELQREAIAYTHDGVALEGFLVYDDAAEGKRPGVLVVHEWWGLNDYVKHRADMLAELGYVAFACDMYGKGKVTTDPKQAGDWAMAVRAQDGTGLRARAQAGLDVLAAHERVDPTRLGAMGYCFGGTTAQQLAFSGADLKGVVSFHGSLIPARPEDNAIKAALLICHGAADPFITQADITAFIQSLDDAKADWTMVSYSGAVHSFSNPAADKVGMNGVGYQRQADERSWAHMQVFFKEIFTTPK